MKPLNDTKWTALASLACALAEVVQSIINRHTPDDNTPEIHERVATLEEKVRRMEDANE